MLSESERCPSLIVVFVEELTVFFVLFVCLFFFIIIIFPLQRNEGFCVCSFGLQSWGLLTFFLHFHPGSRTLRVTDDNDLVIMIIIIIICSSNSVKLKQKIPLWTKCHGFNTEMRPLYGLLHGASILQ